MTTESRKLHALNLLEADFSAALSAQHQTTRPRRRRKLQLAAASAVLLLLLAVVLPRVLTNSPLQATDAAADLADTAAGIAPPPPEQFAYTDSYLIQTNSEGAIPGQTAPPSSELRQRAWSSTARIGRIETTRLTPPRQGMTVSVPLRPSSKVQVGSKSFTLSDLERGGSTVSGLIAAARASGRSAPAAAAQIRWRATIQPLEALAPVLPGATRAALIRELISIPGVRLVSTANDQESYEFVADGRKSVATFSTKTATLLKTSTVVTTPGQQPFPKAPAGTILYSYQLRDIAQVKAIGQTGRPRD